MELGLLEILTREEPRKSEKCYPQYYRFSFYDFSRLPELYEHFCISSASEDNISLLLQKIVLGDTSQDFNVVFMGITLHSFYKSLGIETAYEHAKNFFQIYSSPAL